ncbi:MAG TPA: rhomboid family intramembrane serine protease [Pseudonocardiaceae bacterium]|nr:rhomboid family intramembrane serine protease [Pseudonocardiaceae bacterium]
MAFPPSSPQSGYSHPVPPAVCARHPDRPTGLRCVRCDRSACPECLREASVGYQCVDCVAEGRRTQRYSATIAGARPSGRDVVIPALIAVNVAVFVVTVAQAGSLGDNAAASLFQQWALSPLAVAGGQLWRLLTSGFLHFGPVHLAFNMIALWVIGRDLETVLGRGRFVAVYLVSLLGGSAAVFLLENPDRLTAGASGAVYGLMGGLAVVLLRMRRSPGPALGIIAINVVITFVVPGLSLFGHLGGLAFGTAATAAMAYAPAARRVPVQVAAIVALVVVIAGLVLAADARYGDVRDCRSELPLSCSAGP